MYKKAKAFFMFVETPLHVGSGSDLGIVDLPIQREKHTSFPKIEGSTIKGCIRNAFEKKLDIEKNNDEKENISLVFGPEEGDAHAGALGFTDARLLLFPVKSMKGVFAWITCRKVLMRFLSDLKLAGIEIISKGNQTQENGPINQKSKQKGQTSIFKEYTVPKNCGLFIKDNTVKDNTVKDNTVKDNTVKDNTVKDNTVILEEYAFSNIKEDKNCDILATWLAENVIPKDTFYNYWHEKIKKDIIILSDDDFRDFVNLSTEVITRIKINNQTGTVEKRGLFSEEFLPSESILYSLALSTPIFKENKKDRFLGNKNKREEEQVMDYFIEKLPSVIQIGGGSTIGKGLVRLSVLMEEEQ